MTAAVASAVGVVALMLGTTLGLRIANRRRRPAAVAEALPPPADPVPAALFEELPAGAVVLDRVDAVVLANRAARALGLLHAAGFAAPELRRLVRRTRRDGVHRQAELRVGGDRGQPARPVRARVFPVGPGAVAVIAEDVTEARRVEAMRRDFVANMGHEIKTPVGALTLLAEAALDAQDDPRQVRDFVRRIQKETMRLGRLVQELIELSRLQDGEPPPVGEVVSVDRVLDEAVDRAHSAAEAKRVQVVRGGRRQLAVHGDEGQLVAAVSNLLTNAVRYSPPDSRVGLEARGLEGAVEISVSDHGPGIAPVDQERIFERFYRADPARSRATGGSGLGLAIVKHVVTNHGGQVRVWSRPGAGATFTVRLPGWVAPDGSDGTGAEPPDVQRTAPPAGSDAGRLTGLSRR